MIELIKDNPNFMELDISDALDTLTLEASDITELVFMMKEKKKDADEDAVLSKSYADNQISLNENGKFYIYFTKADYDNLIPSDSYHIAVGIMYDGITSLLELELIGEDRVKIVQDVIRQ